MAIVDRAFNYWFDRFVLDAGINRTDAAQTIAKAAFAAGRRAQAAEPTEARLDAVAPTK